MQVKFLDLQKVTAKYADQMHEAVLRVVDSGWYLQGHENERFEANYSKYIGFSTFLQLKFSLIVQKFLAHNAILLILS